MSESVDRRRFVSSVGLAAALGAGAYVAAPRGAGAVVTPKGKIPNTPFKVGHMTFTSGPGAYLGAPALKGHTLAADEINAEGGFLGTRKIVTITADEAAGVDGNVKELRRMKLSEGIDWFTGVISAGDTVALGPVAEELAIPTIFTDGCTDHLFDVVVRKPKYVFRVTNILSSDAVSCMLAASKTWPNIKRIAHIHPDYNFGRVQFVHSKIAAEKLYPGSEIVSEGWPKLFAGDYAAHITKAMAAKPDLLVTSLWGGDYVSFYKQALRFGMYDQMKVIANIGFGIEPGALGKDHPEGILAGAHANYHFTYPPGNEWPLNKQFVERYHKRWNEYPNYAAEGAYTTLYLLKYAIEKANELLGAWPEPAQIITMLEGMVMATPAGYLHIRAEDHSGFKPTVVGFSKNVPEYPFPIWDPDRIIVQDVRNVSAPPDWPKPGEGHDDPSATYTWIKTTWPTRAI
jgi:branched-chain amino acid transport system substrate-binding protein